MFSDMVKYVSLTTGAKTEKAGKQLLSMLREIYLFTAGDKMTASRVRERTSG